MKRTSCTYGAFCLYIKMEIVFSKGPGDSQESNILPGGACDLSYSRIVDDVN